jgi:hypothetical protein
MSDEERPYRDHSQGEIMREKDIWVKSYRRFLKEFNAAERVGAPDDMASARRSMDWANEQERKLARELELRRKERAEERARRERQKQNRDQSHRSSPPPPQADLTGGALARWFGQLSMEPRDITIANIDFGWHLQGRNYYAVHTPANRLFTVWLEVLPGTPDATIINNASYLPANNPREIGRALEAEKKVRRRQR